MRYLVTARVKTGRFSALRGAIRSGLLGAGSVAGEEYLDDMARARAGFFQHCRDHLEPPYEAFVRHLAEASGIAPPTRAELARFDRSEARPAALCWLSIWTYRPA